MVFLRFCTGFCCYSCRQQANSHVGQSGRLLIYSSKRRMSLSNCSPLGRILFLRRPVIKTSRQFPSAASGNLPTSVRLHDKHNRDDYNNMSLHHRQNLRVSCTEDILCNRPNVSFYCSNFNTDDL